MAPQTGSVAHYECGMRSASCIVEQVIGNVNREAPAGFDGSVVSFGTDLCWFGLTM